MKIAVENKSKLYIALITTLISLIILVTGTYAWFSLSLAGRVQQMELKVTAGDSLYVDTISHGDDVTAFGNKNFVSTSAIDAQLLPEGISIGGIAMDPVTSGTGKKFFSKDGIQIAKANKHYLQFDLYFIATRDLSVRLAGNSDGETDGTKVEWKDTGVTNDPKSAIKECVRISFATPGSIKAKIYEPNKSGTTTLGVANAITDNGGSTAITTFTDSDLGNATAEVFTLKAEKEEHVIVTIWIEGEDAQCLDPVKSAVFLTQLRFLGV